MQPTIINTSDGGAIQLTGHAAVRLQQRGISPWFLRLLIEHGQTSHGAQGAVIKSVSKATRRRLSSVLSRSQYAKAERYFDVYAVLGPDHAVLTAAHRTRKRFH